MKMINLIKIILFFQILILIHTQSNSTNSSNSSNTPNFEDLIGKIFAKLEPECYQDLNYTFYGDDKYKPEKEKNYPWLFDYMGKGFNDIGDECECRFAMKSNTTYLLLYFHDLNLTALLDADRDLIDYLEIKNYIYGLCIMTSCADTVVKYFRIFLDFINYINTNAENKNDIVSFIASNNEKLNDSVAYSFNSTIINVYQHPNDKTKTQKQVLLWLLIGLCFIKLVGAFIRIFTIPKGYDKYIAEKINKEEKLKDGKVDIEEKSNFLSKNKFNEPVDSESMTKDYNPLFDFSEKMPLKVRALRFFDLINDLYYLSSKRNRYYNDSGLEILVFHRAIMIFCLIFSHTFTSLIRLPSEEIINSSFFKSWLNILFRLSNNGFTCWIFLEAAYTTYKLLSFITTEMFLHYCKPEFQRMNYELKLLLIFLKFIVLLLPKFVFFFFIYTFIYYRIEDFEFTSNSPATFRYVFMNLFKEKITCGKLGTLGEGMFNSNTIHNITSYDKCYEFSYFYINMIICILIFMVLTYLFLVIKNKFFEFVVMAGSLFLFFIPNGYIKDPRTDLDDDLYKQNNNTKYFKLYHIIGETYSTKIFTSFIGYYCLGFFFGFILFNFANFKKRIHRLLYEYNSIHLSQSKNKAKEVRESYRPSNISLIRTDTNTSFSDRESAISTDSSRYDESSPHYYKNFLLPYYPLRYLNKILTKIYKFKLSIKFAIMGICSILIILIDLILWIYIYQNGKFKVELNGFNAFIFRYEKHFFVFFYFIVNVMTITLPKNLGIRKFMGSRIFVATSRVGFLISCIIHAFTYFSFLIFSIKVKLYVPSFVLITAGNYLAILIICVLMISVTELPFRIGIKKLMRINRNKGNNNIIL